ncbi:hypothetical protein [Flavobacterium tructae]|uniref:Uncharacterized protein n=1 Tax=Flavobacterium tructae TaxID=1114873 RepID=A0A1S1J763_9FLAO|nr:hypothetical protein [Flavobacterium tructae]OHT45620.1 hypothetical protein BHE19_07230 [Flavobacterium tructae]OXB18278.1 hypothetical protein B0A71_15255 [Flavobacterium tructae]
MYSKSKILLIIFYVLIIANLFSYSTIIYLEKLFQNNDKILEVIITVNGIFSAILTTFLFGRLNISKESKITAKANAISLSEKITALRRILYEVTNYYGVWKHDNSTKNLLEVNKFKSVDYFDYKLMSYSDYKPEDYELIEELNEHEDHLDVESDMFLSMISIVNNRKKPEVFETVLYNDYYDNELIYEIDFLQRLSEINHLSRLSSNLNKYDVFDYNKLNKDSKDRLSRLIHEINSNYDLEKYNFKEMLAVICSDIESDILPKLLKSVKRVNDGLSVIEIDIINTIKVSLLIGVILPLLNLAISEYAMKEFISILFIVANFSMFFYFVFRIKKFSNEQI